MAGFRNYTDFVDALANNGQVHATTFRKAPTASQAATANIWTDLSMIGGFPTPNYYATEPLVAALMPEAKSIHHGEDKSPSYKYLVELGLTSPTAGFVGQYKLMDYLLYYPFVDMDSTDQQTLDNTVTLTRYTDGAGVQVMAVALSPSTGGGVFTFDYINQDGVQKTSPTQTCNTSGVNIGTTITGASAQTGTKGPFLNLASGDSGVRSIVSVTNSVANGGLVALVLVRPLCDHQILEVNTTNEMSYPLNNAAPPRIVDGAFLGLILLPAATIASGTLLGTAKFIWN